MKAAASNTAAALALMVTILRYLTSSWKTRFSHNTRKMKECILMLGGADFGERIH
jgi:hypothetical protein